MAAWATVTVWDVEESLVHRMPIPEIIAQAIFVTAYRCVHKRFAAVVAGSFYGLTRVGEIMRGARRDLMLPSDLLM